MKNHSRKVLTIALLASAAAFGGYRVWQAYEKKGVAERSAAGRGRGAAERVISVSVATARTAPVREDIEITGSLKPKEQVDVTSKVTGRVEKLTLQVGDPVQRGQLIAELDDAELAQQVRRAEAALQVVRATEQQRRAEMANAKADVDRAKQLMSAGLLSRQDYETKMTAFRVVQSQIALTEAQAEQAAAEVRELNIRQQEMRIMAPMSGYIAQRFVDVGAVVSPSTPIVRLVNLATLVTVANVPEREVSKLRVGSRAQVRIDAFGDQVFDGRVARVAPVLDAATRSALVEVEIPNRTGQLKAEMFARVRLDLGGVRDAVLVPRDALVYRGQQAGVFVVQAQKPVFRGVETGSTHGDQVEVLANLEPGTTVVNRGAAMLEEGDRIRVVGEKEADTKPAPEPTSGAATKQRVAASLREPQVK
jgi:RND family efflux transporter MFP subunit